MSSQPPPTVQWTNAQRAAIEERRGEVVVSASAGSGKTAVLTERVLRLVTERDPDTGTAPVPLERLLIITFTEKATRQMRERIEQKLRERLVADPENVQLRDALDKLPEAWILTIDAFCRRVVMEHFHQVGLSPTARIPAEAEAAELELRLLRELLDKRARESELAREELETLLRGLSGSAEALIAQVRGLLGFLATLDRPAEWARRERERLRITLAAREFGELPDAFGVFGIFAEETRELAEALEGVIAQGRACGGDAAVLQEWEGWGAVLREIAAGLPPFAPAGYRALLAPAAGRIDKLMNKGVCGTALFADKAFTGTVLKRFANRYKAWHARWIAPGEAAWLRGAQLAAQRLLALLGLAEAAQSALQTHMQRRGLVTFGDFERLTLELLGADPETGPTAVAYELQARFEYVLVDEYQDTSPLQDAIVARVSRGGDRDSETRANLFIVGDVKQSIYRFRHAEPALFKRRIDAARACADGGGMYGIDLLENFRSRGALLEFVNAVFVRLMDPAVGELEYGARERLIAGRKDDGAVHSENAIDPVCVEVAWLPRRGAALAAGHDAEADAENDADGAAAEGEGRAGDAKDDAQAELALEQLEGIDAQAAWVAERIRALTNPEHGMLIPGEKEQPPRRALAGDCAILLRSHARELETWLLALERAGLRVRAPGIDPLFSAPEIVDLLNALRVADNPFQDFPLASLLRSPLFGFSSEELLRIRMTNRSVPFHLAVWLAAGHALPAGMGAAATPRAHDAATQPLAKPLQARLQLAISLIDTWRAQALVRPPDGLQELILADTGYEAYLTGLPGAALRLEHLDYLRSLLRRLGRGEAGAARGSHGLAVFLQLIDRAEQESGKVGDLPESIAGAEDAVNVLTIHKSKGLEFPIVFVPRLERNFHDPGTADILYDLEAGLGTRGIDVAQRRRYPTLAHERLASLRRRKERSEELRLMYVAMTRARERLILLGQPKGLDTVRAQWESAASRARAAQPLPALARLHARSPAELLGPIAEALRLGGADEARQAQAPDWLRLEYADSLPLAAPAAPQRGDVLRALAQLEPPNHKAALQAAAEGLEREAEAREPLVKRTELEETARPWLLPVWEPHPELAHLPAKTTVTALRAGAQGEPSAQGEAWREEQTFENEDEARRPIYSPATSLAGVAPDFALAGAGLTTLDPQLRGTLHHQLLALADLQGDLSTDGLQAQAGQLHARGLLAGGTREQVLANLDFEALAWFFTTDLGATMIERAGSVVRELPFTTRQPAELIAVAVAEGKKTNAALPSPALPGEFVLVQGMIDVVLDFGDSALIVDYKTDRVYGERMAEQVEALTAKYRLQLELYGEALRGAWGLQRVDAVLVFLSARQVVRLA